jgi:HlyD family secretion protein
MSMDVPREGAARKKLIRRLAVGGFTLAVISLGTVWLSRIKPAAPDVERATVWLDTVKQGPMVREVRGLGSLVPEQILWIPATTDGRVEKLLVLPGAVVKANTALAVLTNPELELDKLDAEYAVKAAEARHKDLEVQLESQRVAQQADLAKIQSDYRQARLRSDRDNRLAEAGLMIELDRQISLAAAEQLENRQKVEKQRLDMATRSVDAQLAVQSAEIDRLRALAEMKRSQVAALRVLAGADGVLQEVPVQVGQRVGAGTILAKVVQPEKLKAELKIPETQAKDVQIGQKVSVDTRNGVIPGRVSRIDPSVRDGTVTVDVKLEGVLPAGARPDLSVDGTIELEHLENVIYVGRPATGQPAGTISLFRLGADGKEASRMSVKLGRASVSTIEVVEGLRPGDQVILSDMSQWDSYDRIRLR